MTIVAIVGADGAGKTTVARALETSSPVPLRYVYMGANIESSNYALPTSRLILLLKRRRFARAAARRGITDPSYLSTHHDVHRSVRYGPATSALRTLNRLAELTYRQLVTRLLERRGYVVVHDRHQLFDSAPTGAGHRRMVDRLYHRVVATVFPEPDMVVFLDAEPAVLHARKGEGTLEHLEARRRAYLAQGRAVRNFVRVDAAQPLERVLDDVGRCIGDIAFSTARRRVPGP